MERARVSHQAEVQRAYPDQPHSVLTCFICVCRKGPWNYTSNKDFLDKFWTEGLERAKPYETMITVGMRGDGDLPLPGANIPIIEDILKNQREIISNVSGKPASEVPQVWCLYTEMLDYWEAGLTAPDDITILWPDDNVSDLSSSSSM